MTEFLALKALKIDACGFDNHHRACLFEMLPVRQNLNDG